MPSEERMIVNSSESEAPSDASAPRVKNSDWHRDQPERPWIVIQPRVGWQTIRVGELWKYRDLLYVLARRDIQVRYKQTVLGATWALIQPLLTMVVFTIFFGRLGGLDRQVDEAYPLFVYAGILPWTFFSTVVSQASMSMLANANIVTKVYFPRLVIPLASAGAPLIDLGVAFLVMLLLMMIYPVSLSPCILLLPLFVLLTAVAALGAGILLAALVVRYRDFRYVVPFLMQIWMFASPVAYPFEEVPGPWRLAYAINPMAGIISGFRSALLAQPLHIGSIAVSTVVSLAVFVFALAVFSRLERQFADIV